MSRISRLRGFFVSTARRGWLGLPLFPAGHVVFGGPIGPSWMRFLGMATAESTEFMAVFSERKMWPFYNEIRR